MHGAVLVDDDGPPFVLFGIEILCGLADVLILF
jgi:hypothetical protein